MSQINYAGTASAFDGNGHLMEVSIVSYPGPGYNVYPMDRVSRADDVGFRQQFAAAIREHYEIEARDSLIRSFLRRADVNADWCLRETLADNERFGNDLRGLLALCDSTLVMAESSFNKVAAGPL